MLEAAAEVVSQKTVMQRLKEKNSSRPFVRKFGLASEPQLAAVLIRDGGYLKQN
jgi:hypothetical protein